MVCYKIKFNFTFTFTSTSTFTFTAERRMENDLKWLQDFRGCSNIIATELRAVKK